MNRLVSFSEFSSRASIVHSNKYSYTKETQNHYINTKNKVPIFCNFHSEYFWQTPSSHLTGRGCPKCKIVKITSLSRHNKDIFITKALEVPEHQNKQYNYDKVIYKSTHSKVEIVCLIHGSFWQEPANHLQGFGCPKCARELISKKESLSFNEFIDRANLIHCFKYDYSEVNYTTIFNKVQIICAKHGSFFQKAHDHLNGNGCPKCNASKGELHIEQWLKERNIQFIPQKRFENCRNKLTLPFDFFIQELNICIEYDGQQHFYPCGYGGDSIKAFQRTKTNDSIKTNFCKNQGINLYRISYKDNIDQKLTNIFR